MINIDYYCKGSDKGYVFKLEERSGHAGTVTSNTGFEVVFVGGSCYVYVYMQTNDQFPDSLELHLEALQNALDFLSIQGIQNSTVRVPLSQYLQWLVKNNSCTVTLVEKSRSNSTATVGDKSRLTITQQHDGFRFYRLAQTSRDLFEAYRNLWLSFESLASTHYPRISRKETEGNWWVRVIKNLADNSPDKEMSMLLAEFTPEELYKELYKGVRCSLFHSKYGEEVLTPIKLSQYPSVKASLAKLTVIVSTIIWRNYGIKSNYSWVNPNVLTKVHKELFSNTILVISNDDFEGVRPEVDFSDISNVCSTDNVIHTVFVNSDYVNNQFKASISLVADSWSEAIRFSFVKENRELVVFTLDESLCTKNISILAVESYWGLRYLEKPVTYGYWK